MNKDEYYLNMLANWLRDHDEYIGNHKLASCIVYKNIVVFGHNKAKTNTFQERFNPEDYNVYTHAEIDALKNAIKRIPINKLHKATMYVVRVKKAGSIGLAKPCNKGCSQAINRFNIGRVVYTTENGYEVIKHS